MLKIDTHQHFWKYNPVKHAWINDEMAVIQKDFLPIDLSSLLKNDGFEGCIAVQADENEAENDFLLDIASKNDFVKGVIGWVDFFGKDVESKLNEYQQFNKMKGFRYILQDKQPKDLMLSKAFTDGIALLKKYDFLYEILIFSDQLIHAKALVAMFPHQKFVLNHLAKPMIKLGEINSWKKDISVLAEYDNVYCKVSGMVTEADWKNWKYEDFEPYLDVAFNSFGPDRLLFGSDWPVCNLAGDYQSVYALTEQYVEQLSISEQEKFLGKNAVKCYQLS